ncbi:hypothetical protein ScPMuIL_014745 [Solemya velum]
MDLDDLQLTSGDMQQMFVGGDFDALAPANPVYNSIPVQAVQAVNMVSESLQTPQPYVQIIEQPKSRGLRFRYKCEGRSAGSIPGETSTQERKTYPAIKLHNFEGSYFIVVVSCVSKDAPHRPHPHNLVGRDCKKGVCTVKVKDNNLVTFPHLGIQCAKKNDVDLSLQQRKEINVDPYQTGFNFPNKSIDLNSVRLCFQVFLPDKNQKPTRIVPPKCSQVIYDKKSLNELVICRVDRASGKAKGGEEVFLLCEKINRDDIKVRFYKENDTQLLWEDFGDFGQNDVHRQYAIVFKTPPYVDTLITQPVEVKLQLFRPSDSEISDPITFTYKPEDPDPDRIQDKRKRKSEALRDFFDSADKATVSPEEIKARLKRKANRSQMRQDVQIKQEAPDVPTYSFDNLGARSTMVGTSTILNPGQINVISSDNNTLGHVTFSGAGGQLQSTILDSGVLLQQGQQQQQGVRLLQSAVPQSVSGGQYWVPSFQTGGMPTTTASATVTSQNVDSGGDIIGSDVNMAAANMPSLDLNMFQQYLGDQGGAAISFGSIEGLSGNLGTLDYDPNIGAMESVEVHSETIDASQIEETNEAIQAIERLKR